MAYDEDLAQRVRGQLSGEAGLSERAMFGRLALLLDGNMSVAISGEDLMVRVGPAAAEDALSRPHARPCKMTGRPMRGWILVAPGGVETDGDLAGWVRRGVELARSLPAKR